MFIGRTQIGVDFELHFTRGFKPWQFLGGSRPEPDLRKNMRNLSFSQKVPKQRFISELFESFLSSGNNVTFWQIFYHCDDFWCEPPKAVYAWNLLCGYWNEGKTMKNT